MSNRCRPVVLLALACVAIGAAVGVALAAGTSPSRGAQRRVAHEPGSTVNRGRAIADARRRLRSFVPPPGSRRVEALPKSLRLNGPGQTIASPRFLDLGATWVTSEPVDSVRAYLQSHHPPGSSYNSSGESGDRDGTYRWDYGYEWPPLPDIADLRELLVGVVARPGGGAALRADAQATYVEPKPEGERIPPGASYLEAEESLGRKVRTVGTANAAKVEATAKLIDGFPILQENGPTECGLIPSVRVTLKGTFRAAPGGPVLAETEQHLPAGVCDFVGLTIGGKDERPLEDTDEGLVKALQGLLARKYEKSLLAGIQGS